MLSKNIFKKLFPSLSIFLTCAIFLSFRSPAIATSYSTDIINKRVYLLIFNPTITDSGTKLISYKGWETADSLSNQVVSFFNTASHGILRYQIAQRSEIDAFPVKADGFTYTKDEYLACLANKSTCHDPDTVDYVNVLNTYDICGKLNRGEIDEVWMWGGPYFGYYESILAGPGGYWYNSSPITGSSCGRLIPIMGLNYEVAQGNAVESFGHRAEATMSQLYGGWDMNSSSNNWNKFTMNFSHTTTSDVMGCGNVHFAPNSTSDYDWGNGSTVETFCDQFANSWPSINPTGAKRSITCSEWGCSQIGYFNWWFSHMPAYNGVAPDGKYASWWKYIGDPNRVYEAASCSPICGGKACGAEDGCGGRCAVGICNQPPANGCPNPRSLRIYNNSGTCKPDYTCEYGSNDLYCAFGCNQANTQCNGCIPSCTNKECGSDGCGGTCGICGIGKACNTDSKCSNFNIPLSSVTGTSSIEVGELSITDFSSGEVVKVEKPKSILEIGQGWWNSLSESGGLPYIGIGLAALILLLVAIVLAKVIRRKKIAFKISNPFKRSPKAQTDIKIGIVEKPGVVVDDSETKEPMV